MRRTSHHEALRSIPHFRSFALPQLLHLFMVGVLTATFAKLAELQTISCGLAVLGRRVIPLFALTALHRNNFSGH